jgi:hypothetical protein
MKRMNRRQKAEGRNKKTEKQSKKRPGERSIRDLKEKFLVALDCILLSAFCFLIFL